MHEVLVNRIGGLSLPRKSVVRLTDSPDMTSDVYRGRKTTTQPMILLASSCILLSWLVALIISDWEPYLKRTGSLHGKLEGRGTLIVPEGHRVIILMLLFQFFFALTTQTYLG